MNITGPALEAIRSHASEGFPLEICGMLLAVKGSRDVIETRRATNAAPEMREVRYRIDHREHRKIEDEADARGMEIVGYYHSHPNHAAYASRFDTEDAWPSAFYVIASCIEREVREVKVFQKPGWDSEEMVEEPLQVTD
ncbi:MAG TPA: M67 family metallopeptidase [Candidatus Dormibacteraeota bacterium]|nr:M67 family metallopeptidase [Candidatus Dormibacteraeota bacterium]